MTLLSAPDFHQGAHSNSQMVSPLTLLFICTWYDMRREVEVDMRQTHYYGKGLTHGKQCTECLRRSRNEKKREDHDYSLVALVNKFRGTLSC